MKHTDIQKLFDAGLISEDQRQKIIEHFDLKEEGGNKFLAIISIIGAVLVVAGIILLISAHWNEIPRGVKIAVGIMLMLGAHGGGWWLREIHGKYPKCGEALHLIGSGLFLANIALLGQVYNIISRPPNAFLLWWIGIAALPWLLRSRAQHVLLLIAFGIWFGFEVNESGSWFFCDSDKQILLYSLMGLIYLGGGYCLRGTKFSDFAGVTEKLGLLVFLIFFFPLTWKAFFWNDSAAQSPIFPILCGLTLIPIAVGMTRLTALNRQWRWTWTISLAAMMMVMATAWYNCWALNFYPEGRYSYWGENWAYLVATIALFVFCLLQIQVGLQLRSKFLVNAGVAFIALDIIAAYFDLFGSMARTGVMFLVSGIFLIVFGVYLERKRRKLMKQLRSERSRS